MWSVVLTAVCEGFHWLCFNGWREKFKTGMPIQRLNLTICARCTSAPLSSYSLKHEYRTFLGKNFHRPEKNDAEMSLLFTQSSYNGEIKAERIDARLPAWLDHPSALIFPGDLVAGGRPNCEMKAKFTGNQFKSLWSHYSQVITLCNPHLLHDSMFKKKSLYNRKGRKIDPPKAEMNLSFP